jgi:hydroxyacyl-ACP dehydratase HTD2-like protein with hotdog domain
MLDFGNLQRTVTAPASVFVCFMLPSNETSVDIDKYREIVTALPPLMRCVWDFHNFRHSLATALVKLKVDPKTVQGVLRHEDFGTTMELYAQSDMESMRDAQGKFLEQLMGDRIHLLTERVQ